LGESVIDLNDHRDPATVKKLTGLWRLLGGLVIIRNCDVAIVGDNNTVATTIDYTYPDAEVDAVQLFSEKPALARLLLDAVADGSIDRWTARLTDELEQEVVGSTAVQHLPSEYVVRIPDRSEPHAIKGADIAVVGARNSLEAEPDWPSVAPPSDVLTAVILERAAKRRRRYSSLLGELPETDPFLVSEHDSPSRTELPGPSSRTERPGPSSRTDGFSPSGF
jgi:hypothetical protein